MTTAARSLYAGHRFPAEIIGRVPPSPTCSLAAPSRADLLERMVTVDMPLGSADPPPPLRYPADYLHRRWALLAEGDVEGLVRLQARYILAQPEEADAAKLWVENVLRLPR
jgi:hypothetical protein